MGKVIRAATGDRGNISKRSAQPQPRSLNKDYAHDYAYVDYDNISKISKRSAHPQPSSLNKDYAHDYAYDYANDYVYDYAMIMSK